MDESLKIMKEVEEVKLKKKKAEDEYHAMIPRHAHQQQKLKACEVRNGVGREEVWEMRGCEELCMYVLLRCAYLLSISPFHLTLYLPILPSLTLYLSLLTSLPSLSPPLLPSPTPSHYLFFPFFPPSLPSLSPLCRCVEPFSVCTTMIGDWRITLGGSCTLDLSPFERRLNSWRCVRVCMCVEGGRGSIYIYMYLGQQPGGEIQCVQQYYETPCLHATFQTACGRGLFQ